MSTTARGYGAAHQRERARVKPAVEAGHAHCWRCERWINPSEPWDLGHDDHDRRLYKGPEHRACNRRTSQYSRPMVPQSSTQGHPGLI